MQKIIFHHMKKILLTKYKKYNMINVTKPNESGLYSKNLLNTSFESENSTTFDNNMSTMKHSKNEEFDSETENVEDDSEIDIISYEEVDEANQLVKNPPLLLESISSTLQKLIEETSKKYYGIKKVNPTSIFNSTIPPQISVFNYLTRIVKYTNVEQSTLIISIIYIDRLCQKNYFINEHNIHKLLFTSILIAIKYQEDDYYKLNYYAQIAGVSLKDLIKMERDFLSLLDFSLFINEDLFEKYKNGLIKKFLL